MLVLGGTSLIGAFLLPRLVNASFAVTGLSRAPRAPIPGVDWLQGDGLESGLAERLPPLDTVFSLSPIWLLPEVLPALASRGAKRLIAFSSTSAVTKANSPIASERAVAARLADGEAATIQGCEAAGIAWTILRPTLIYSEGRDQNVSRLASLIGRLGVLPLSGAGAGLRQPVHADDLARVALAALDRPASLGRTYDLPGGETLSYRTMVARVFEGLGRRPRILVVPPSLWRLGLGLLSPLLPGATAAMGERMASDLTFDAAPAQRDLGWAPRPFRPRFR